MLKRFATENKVMTIDFNISSVLASLYSQFVIIIVNRVHAMVYNMTGCVLVAVHSLKISRL